MKTPVAERAAGRKKLAARGQALPDGTAPVPDLAYLKKAIRAKGRVSPAKWPALKKLIVKRARQLGATGAPGVKGTWAFQAANDARAVELAGAGTTYRYRHGWILNGVSADDAPEEKADKMSGNAFRRGDGTQEALQGHRDAARAHRAAAQLSSSPARSAYHARMAVLHSRVAGLRMTSNRADDQAHVLGQGVKNLAGGAPALELTGDGHGRHVAGTPDVYSHGWEPRSGSTLGADGIRRPGKGTALKKAAGPTAKLRLVATGKPYAPGSGDSKGILSGPHPADRLTVASDKGATAKAMSDGDLKSADRELATRAALLGKPGQLSRAHKAARAEIARRAATGPQAARAAPKGKPATGNAAYDHVAEPAGKRERDAADYYSVASTRLNTPLRSGTKVTNKQDAAQLRALESTFAKSPPTTRHIVAYRGTTGSLFGEGDATGTEFTDKGFTSVSTDQKQAAMFGPEKGSALMEIRIPAGSKVVKPGGAGHYSSGGDAEKELVLNHGGRYKITSDQMVNDPQYGKIRKLTATYRGPA